MVSYSITVKDAFASIICGALALTIFGVQPVLYSAYVAEGLVSEARLGLLAAAEVLSIALGSAVAIPILRRYRSRPMAMSGIALLIAGNLLLSGNESTLLVFLFRALAGFGAGLLAGVAAAAIARTTRVGGWQSGFLFFQALAQVGLMKWFEVRAPSAASFNIQIALCVVAVAALLTLPFIPAKFDSPNVDERAGTLRPDRHGWTLLLSILLQTGGAIGIWAYIAVWLQSRGVPAGSTIHHLLGASLLGQVIGSAIASALGEGRLVWLRFLILKGMLLGALFFWLQTPNSWIGPFFYGILWMMVTPTLISVLNTLDPDRRALPYATAAQLMGAAIIPTAVGELLAGTNLDYVIMACAVILALSAALVLGHLPTIRRTKILAVATNSG